jgi:hypothetical protein
VAKSHPIITSDVYGLAKQLAVLYAVLVTSSYPSSYSVHPFGQP